MFDPFITTGVSPAAYCALCVVSIGALFVLFRKGSKRLEPPVYPYWLPWLGHTFAFLRNAEGLYADARRYFASTAPFSLHLGGSTLYVLSDPRDAKAIYQNSKQLSFAKIADEFERTAFGISKAGSEKFWRDIPGEGRLFENAHAFYQKHLTSTDTLNPLSNSYLSLLTSDLLLLHRRGDVLDLPAIEWCQETVFTAATTAMWGPALLQRNPEMWKTLRMFDRDLYLLVFQFPAFMCRGVLRHRDTLVSALEDYYDNLQELESISQPCIWERQHMHYRAGLSGREAASFNLSFFWGLNLNLVKTVSWMTYFVSITPGLQERIRAETTTLIGDDPRDLSLAALVERCPLLNASLDETLRLVSSSTSTRLVMEDVVVGGTVLRAGNRVMLPSQHLHRDEQSWGEDVDSFRPERFLTAAKSAPEGLYRPFGGGSSLCPGRFFARRAVTSFVAVLLHLFDVQISGADVVPDHYRPRLAVVDPLPGAENARIVLSPRGAVLSRDSVSL